MNNKDVVHIHTHGITAFVTEIVQFIRKMDQITKTYYVNYASPIKPDTVCFHSCVEHTHTHTHS